MADFQGVPREVIESSRVEKLRDKGGFSKSLILTITQ